MFQNRVMTDWVRTETPQPGDPLVTDVNGRGRQIGSCEYSRPKPFVPPAVFMASSENQQHTFPAVPPSLSAGDHEMRDYYAPQDASRPTINQTPYLTPYLGLRARLSQVWINRWTVLLFLVLVRTLIAIANINENLDSARAKALRACTEVESVGSAMASMPHYMSQGVNELAVNGVEKAVNGLMSMLTLSVTGVEEIILFVINMMTSTYVCLITLAIRGSVGAAAELAKEATEILTDVVPKIGDDIASVASTFESKFNDFVNALNSLPFGGASAPTLDLGDNIQKLKNLQMPTDITDGLGKLNNSIPTFEQVQNFTNSVIRIPFEEVKRLINDSMTTFTFDRSLLPVPQKEQLNFCSDNNGINEFFDGLVELEIKARKIFIGVVVVLAILVCVPMAYREIRRWRIMQQRAQLISKNSFDPMDVVYISSRPYSSSFGIKLANRFSSTRTQTLIRWAIAYATSTPALFVLSLGVAGLFACLCQYILLKSLEKEVPALTAQVADFADAVITSLNNASESWALGVNQAVNKTNSDINSDIFGWVNTTTTAVNSTLNEFVDGMRKVLDETIGGVPVLKNAVEDVLNCLITLKIQGIQKGLTWVSDHAHVDFPMFANDTFSLGALAKVSNSSSAAELLADPSGTTKDEISEAVVDLTNKLQDGIRTEAIISTCVVLIWVFIVLIGVFRACMLLFVPGKTRAEGGQAYTIDPATDNLRGHNNPPDTAAPPYEYPVNKAAPYTIQPRPFPTFEPATDNYGGSAPEKVGQVGAHIVGDSVARPGHLRASSYGDVGGVSPNDEKSRSNPFAV